MRALSSMLPQAGALAGFQTLLSRCPTAADRKGLILAAWEHGAIDRVQTRLLVEAHALETA